MRRRSSILWIEIKTVLGCLPPNSRPILGREAEVSCLTKYIATWRARTIDLELFGNFRSGGNTPKCSPTRSWIILIVANLCCRWMIFFNTWCAFARSCADDGEGDTG